MFAGICSRRRALSWLCLTFSGRGSRAEQYHWEVLVFQRVLCLETQWRGMPCLECPRLLAGGIFVGTFPAGPHPPAGGACGRRAARLAPRTGWRQAPQGPRPRAGAVRHALHLSAAPAACAYYCYYCCCPMQRAPCSWCLNAARPPRRAVRRCPRSPTETPPVNGATNND